MDGVPFITEIINRVINPKIHKQKLQITCREDLLEHFASVVPFVKNEEWNEIMARLVSSDATVRIKIPPYDQAKLNLGETKADSIVELIERVEVIHPEIEFETAAELLDFKELEDILVMAIEMPEPEEFRQAYYHYQTQPKAYPIRTNPSINDIWLPNPREYEAWCRAIGNQEAKRLFDMCDVFKRHLKEQQISVQCVKKRKVSLRSINDYTNNLANIEGYILKTMR